MCARDSGNVNKTTSMSYKMNDPSNNVLVLNITAKKCYRKHNKKSLLFSAGPDEDSDECIVPAQSRQNKTQVGRVE